MTSALDKTRISRKFFTGQNSFDNPSTIGVTECASIENGLINQAGLITKRTGLTEIGTTISGATDNDGLGKLEVEGANTLFSVERTNLYRLSGSTWTSIKTDLTTGLETTFVQADNLLFLSNGTDNVFSVNTSFTVTDEGSTSADPPLGTVMEYHDNRLFIAGVSSEPGVLYWSNVSDPQTFDQDFNKSFIWKGARGDISALVSYKNKELVVFKTDGIAIVNTNGANPNSDWQLINYHTEIGCPAGKTAVRVGNDVFFLANDGVRSLVKTQFDTTQDAIVSREVQDVIDSINTNAITTCTAAYFDNKYLLAVPCGTATTPDTVLIYDLLATKNARSKGINVNAWTVVPSADWEINHMLVSKYNTAEELVLGMSDTGKIYSALNGSDDDGTNINVSIAFREEDFDLGDMDKDYSHIYATAEGGENEDVQFFYSINGSQDQIATEPTSLNLSGDAVNLPIDLPFDLNDDTRVGGQFHILARAKICQVHMLHNEDSGYTFRGYELYGTRLDQGEDI